MMSFTDALKTCYKKSFTTEGRASRSEYWWFQTHIPVVLLFAVMLDPDGELLVAPFALLFLVSVPANFCVTVRRWHDLGKSGWYTLLLIFYPIGFPITWIYFCMDSVKIDNMDGGRPVVFDPARSTTYRQQTTPPVAPVPQVAPVPPVAPVQQTVYQNIIQGDHITKTEVKDSVLNRSNLGGSSKMDQVKELKELHDTGAISDEDYEKMKREIVG